jgi:hypothetical protein
VAEPLYSEDAAVLLLQPIPPRLPFSPYARPRPGVPAGTRGVVAIDLGDAEVSVRLPAAHGWAVWRLPRCWVAAVGIDGP